MRRALVLCLLSCLAADASSCRPTTSAASGLAVLNPVGNRPTFYDFGKVLYGPPVEHVFKIRNDDPSPVTIRDILPSCSCTLPRISYVAKDGSVVEGDPTSRERVLVLPGGAVADLALRIDTTRIERMNLDKLAQVRMRTDSASTPYMTFELHVVVARAMLSVPAAVDLGQVPQSVGKSGRSDVMPDDVKAKYRILGVESVDGPFAATVDETVVAEVPTWIVVVSTKPNLELGPVSGAVHLSVSGEDGTGTGPSFKLPVSGQIAPDVVARPPVLGFGAIERGKAAEVGCEIVALVPGELVRVTGTKVVATPESVASAIVADAEPVAPGDGGSASTWRIRLRASEALAEPQFSGTIVLELDHPRVREVRVPFSGTTR